MNKQAQPQQNDYPYSLDTRGLTIEEEIAQIEKAGFQKRWGSVWEWERLVPQVVIRPKRLLPCIWLVLAVAVTAVLFSGVIPATPYPLVIYFMGGLVACACFALSVSMFSRNSRLAREANAEKVEVYRVKRLNPVEKMIREIYFRPDTFSRTPHDEMSRCYPCQHNGHGDR